jgi:DNA-binding PadR family transcriptional regulator
MSKPYSGIYIERELVKSSAFHKLSGTAHCVLMHFLGKRQIGRGSRASRPVLNNGRIVFPYTEAEEYYEISRSSFSKALGRLVEYGFIDITHVGGGREGDCNLFAISDRWKKWGTEEFVSKTRKKRKSFGLTSKNWEQRTGKTKTKKKIHSIESDTATSIESNTGIKELPVSLPSENRLGMGVNFFMRRDLEVLQGQFPSQSNQYQNQYYSIDSIYTSDYSPGYHPLR